MCLKGGCGLWRWALSLPSLNLFQVFKISPSAFDKYRYERQLSVTKAKGWTRQGRGGEEEKGRRWQDREGRPASVVKTSTVQTIQTEHLGGAGGRMLFERLFAVQPSPIIDKHRKNCECCPVSQLIVKWQRLSWIQVLICQNCNQCLKCHKS